MHTTYDVLNNRSLQTVELPQFTMENLALLLMRTLLHPKCLQLQPP